MKLLFVILIAMAAEAAPGKMEVQGHRGARAVRPENTIPAFLFALEAGVDTLEMDMHVTKDDQIVITHDPYLNPETCLDKAGKKIGPKVLVRSLTLKELQGYDCGSLVNPRFPAQKVFPKTSISTLDEIFTFIKKSSLASAKTVQFNIETKSEEAHPEFTPDPEEFVKMFLSVVRKHKMLRRVTLQSFDYRTLKAAHKLEPDLKLSVLVEDRPANPEDLTRLIKENSAQILSPNHEWLTAKDVAELHKIGARVIPWTPNLKTDWQRLVDIGVDGIISDNPKELIEFLRH